MTKEQLSPEWALIQKIVSQYGNAVAMPFFEQWVKDYADKKAHPLIDALRQISQMSDPGDYITAIIDMKSIATTALDSYAGSAEEEKEEFGEWLERCCDPHSTSVKEPKKKDPWISVKDRLPKLTEPATFFNDETGQREVYKENDHATILAYNPDLGVYKAEYNGKRWCEISSVSIKSGGSAIPTHWMPLPEPPAANNQEGGSHE